MNKHKILIIDDSDSVRTALRDALQQSILSEIHEAKNGLEGLVRAKQVRPDLILLDYNMPGLDGGQVLSHMRDETALSECRVIVITSEHSRPTVELFAEYGVRNYVVKPFLLADIIKRVKDTLVGEPTGF